MLCSLVGSWAKYSSLQIICTMIPIYALVITGFLRFKSILSNGLDVKSRAIDIFNIGLNTKFGHKINLNKSDLHIYLKGGMGYHLGSNLLNNFNDAQLLSVDGVQGANYSFGLGGQINFANKLNLNLAVDNTINKLSNKNLSINIKAGYKW